MDGVEIPSNIKAAIRRSRAVRGELRARRRRTAAIIAGLSLAVAVPLSLTFSDFGAGDVLEAAVAKAQSLADMLDKRSPGERTSAQLTKTKRARALAKLRVAPRQAPAPPETTLAKILMGPPEPLPVELAAAPLPLIASPTLPGGITMPPGGGGPVIVPPGGGGTVVTPPGGGTLPGQPTPPIVTPPGQPSPVPEPATWAMMLLGFGLIGWRIRKATRGRFAAA